MIDAQILQVFNDLKKGNERNTGRQKISLHKSKPFAQKTKKVNDESFFDLKTP